MPPITELPAAARLLPVDLPTPLEPSIIAPGAFGSITEFLRLTWSRFVPTSAISPTDGSALELL